MQKDEFNTIYLKLQMKKKKICIYQETDGDSTRSVMKTAVLMYVSSYHRKHRKSYAVAGPHTVRRGLLQHMI